jgi:hypothetical protein
VSELGGMAALIASKAATRSALVASVCTTIGMSAWVLAVINSSWILLATQSASRTSSSPEGERSAGTIQGRWFTDFHTAAHSAFRFGNAP